MKIDLMIVPTVSILYLFCFIDVSLSFSIFSPRSRRPATPPALRVLDLGGSDQTPHPERSGSAAADSAFVLQSSNTQRANIGNARLAGLEKDLGLTGYDYNILLTCFYISYILFEIPSK